MTRYSSRPRAPSPPRSPITSEEDAASNASDNTYSVVQDDLSTRSPPPPAPPPKTRVGTGVAGAAHHHNHRHGHGHGGQRRMFGDSVDPSPTGSVLSASPSSSSAASNGNNAVEELASLYQARNGVGVGGGGGGAGGAGRKKYDSVTVEEIKAQFQKQIEAMLQSQERHEQKRTTDTNKVKLQVTSAQQHRHHHPPPPPQQQHQQPPSALGLRKSHFPTTAEKELTGIRDLQRGKSFAEARTAVQKHIERMFSDNSGGVDSGGMNAGVGVGGGVGGVKRPEAVIKHTMHGVSHRQGDDDDGIEPPPPTHYGVTEAIRDRNNNSRKDDQEGSGSGNGGRWRSVESLLEEQQEEQRTTRNRSDLAPNKFRSVDNLRSDSMASSSGHGRLRRTVVDIDIEGGGDEEEDEGEEDGQQRSRRFKMENGKPWEASASTGRPFQRQNAAPPTDRPQGGSKDPAAAAASDPSPASGEASLSLSAPLPEALKKDFVKHKVDYLGALPISPRATNLASLQRPLKDLYFKYRALRNLGQTNLPGTLEINDTGLTVQYIRELHKGVQEIFNPFPTIAVWAAVKFVHKREVVPNSGNMHHQYAFLPLISDPDSQEKHRLFQDLDYHEVELAADAPHPPVFACVMRRNGVPKQLECHGFVCTSSEDAIIIAANLYQALLETMKRQRQDQARRQRQQRLAARKSKGNGGGGSGGRGGGDDDDDIAPPPAVFSDSDSAAPLRPPRRKNRKGGRGSDAGSNQGTVLQRKKSLRSSIRSNRSNNGKGPKRASVTIDPARRNMRVLGRSDSGRRSGRSNTGSGFARRSTRKSAKKTAGAAGAAAAANLQNSPIPYGTQQAHAAVLTGGDVYTRVAIPRSKSFMNVGSQYNLQELFRELKEKEGVESIDDVLKKIITPNGISFNEIKPVYRELLLKLAMTMSQDEIFQRSKNIISQEKKKRKETKKEKSGSNGNESSSNTISSFFKMTFSSSSKSNSLAGKKGGKGGKAKEEASSSTLNSRHNTFGREERADSGLGSGGSNLSNSNGNGTGTGTGTGTGGKMGMKPLPLIPSSMKGGKDRTISKADISGPLPITAALPTPSSSLHKYGSPKATTTQRKAKGEEATRDPDGAYVSCCSECGGVYESVCNYDACSCRVKESPQRESIHPAKDGRVPFPPSPTAAEEQHPTIIKRSSTVAAAGKPPLPHAALSSTSGRANRLRKQQDETESETYCDCDADSCASSEKCYCSLRGDPREQKHQHRTRVAVRQAEAEEESSPPHHHRTPNNTTIIHCNGGSGTDTIRSFSSVSSCSTCNFHTCDSGSTATDTTCYSIKRANGHNRDHSAERYRSHSSLLSGCESPQTAWSRNSRLTSPDNNHRHRHDDRHSCVGSCPSEYSDASLARKKKPASVCRSSETCSSCSHHHPHVHHENGRGRFQQESNTGGRVVSSLCGSSSCSNSSSGCSHRSAPVYGGHHHPRSGMKRATSKVLLVSATDKSGRVVYRGASSASNLTTLDENASYHGSYHPRPRSRGRLPPHHASHGHLPVTTTVSTSRVGPDAGAAADRSSILSMKKSAEIAAVFSGARINQTTDIVDELQDGSSSSSSNSSGGSDGGGGGEEGDCGRSCCNGYNSDGADSTDAAYETRKVCAHCGSNRQNRPGDMKSSLGYFP